MTTEPASRRTAVESNRAEAARDLSRARALGLAVAIVAASLTPAGRAQDGPASLPTRPAHDWASDCVNSELMVIDHPGSYLRFRFHEVDDKGDRVRDQIETPQGTVSRLVLRDGRALSPDEDAAERSRLTGLLSSPDAFARRIHGDQNNKKMGMRLLKMMPDAMLWSYAPGQPQLTNGPRGERALVVLDFKPNPHWSPPDMESGVLTGVEGRAWIDPQRRELVHLDGDLFRPVNIGWGMLAHLYPGGTVALDQTGVAGERWIVEHVVEQLTVRALMVKTVKQRLVFDTSEYKQEPAMSYQEAIKLLLATPLPQH